ncbi:MAG: hypothetical protein QOJ07_90 [Thermoleophilaceae bacterium]|nr:hypothetical protein [Thermoleophilaceae bacterium]
MTQNDESAGQDTGQSSSTSPPEGKTSEDTTPPGNPDVDQEAVDESEDKLEQAGGGH